MKIMFACLADHASADQAGNKLNVMGIFDSIHATAFPAAHARMFLVFRIMAEHEDGGKTTSLVVTLRDEDHREYARLQAQVASGPVPPGKFSTVNNILELTNVVFAKPGRYHFALGMDDAEEVRVPLEVNKV